MWIVECVDLGINQERFQSLQQQLEAHEEKSGAKRKDGQSFTGDSQESSNQEKETGEQGSDESKESTSETIIETEEGLMGPPQPKSPIVGDEVEETIQSLRTELAETKELNT